MIRSTKNQIEEFLESFIWKDIVDELQMLATKSQNEYDSVGEARIDGGLKVQPTTAETLIHLGIIKGNRQAVQYFLDIPNILLQELESKNDSRCDETE